MAARGTKSGGFYLLVATLGVLAVFLLVLVSSTESWSTDMDDARRGSRLVWEATLDSFREIAARLRAAVGGAG